MDFDDIFTAYYTLYRAEAEIPASDDDEYTIALRLANESIAWWANYDGTYWKELFTTNQLSTDGVKIITAPNTTYAAPTNMKEAGGYVKLVDPTTKSTVRRIPIIEPQDAQFRNDNASYCYFTGNPSSGFTLHINGIPTSDMNGLLIDYIYYMKPSTFSAGADKTQMKNPYFIVNRVLGNRFRASRNPYYQSAIKDSEDELRIMQLDNNSGNWADPWKLADNSGSEWGN